MAMVWWLSLWLCLASTVGGASGGLPVAPWDIPSATGVLHWSLARTMVETALDAYDPSSFAGYTARLETDLAPWAATNISRAVFEHTLTSQVYNGRPARAARLSHYQAIGGRLYRSEHCYFPARCKGVEYFLLQVIGDMGDFEVVVNIQDYPHSGPVPPGQEPLPILSFSRSSKYHDIHYPAWTFWAGGPATKHDPRGIGRWDNALISMAIAENKWPWEDKLNQVFFRGSRTDRSRDPLIRLGQTHPELFDVALTASGSQKTNALAVAEGLGPMVPQVAMEDHCQYRHLFNFKGVAASFRYKYLFLCKAVVYQVHSDWGEFFYDELLPWVHYVPVAADMQDAQAVLAFFSDPANESYWRRLLTRVWALCPWEVRRRRDTVEVFSVGNYGPPLNGQALAEWEKQNNRMLADGTEKLGLTDAGTKDEL